MSVLLRCGLGGHPDRSLLGACHSQASAEGCIVHGWRERDPLSNGPSTWLRSLLSGCLPVGVDGLSSTCACAWAARASSTCQCPSLLMSISMNLLPVVSLRIYFPVPSAICPSRPTQPIDRGSLFKAQYNLESTTPFVFTVYSRNFNSSSPHLPSPTRPTRLSTGTTPDRSPAVLHHPGYSKNSLSKIQ